jgi:hypothetical protein
VNFTEYPRFLMPANTLQMTDAPDKEMSLKSIAYGHEIRENFERVRHSAATTPT